MRPDPGHRPRYSVIVPAYNEADFLGRTLASLCDQDFRGAYEVVVVDNNSTDQTAAVARSFGVRVVSETVQGTCAARQRGAEEARGEILVSVDADTVYPRDWLSRIDAGFLDPVVAVAGPCRYQVGAWWLHAFTTILFGLVAGCFALFGVVFYVSATNLAVRRSAFPGYDPRLTQGGDELDLLRRVRRRGRVVWLSDNPVSTSARRVARGLVHTLFVALLYHYVLTYLVNRLTGRRSLGMAPAYRFGMDSLRSAPVAARPGLVVGLLASRRWLAVGALAVVLGLAAVAPASANEVALLWHHHHLHQR